MASRFKNYRRRKVQAQVNEAPSCTSQLLDIWATTSASDPMEGWNPAVVQVRPNDGFDTYRY